MVQLNKIGTVFAKLPYVKAMTDVTGFGLLGHLSEMCEASDLSAVVQLDKVPLLDKAMIDHYLAAGCVPGGTKRNYASYGHKIAPISDYQRNILCDPQTSGGLLVAVESKHVDNFKGVLLENNLSLDALGHFVKRADFLVKVL